MSMTKQTEQLIELLERQATALRANSATVHEVADGMDALITHSAECVTRLREAPPELLAEEALAVGAGMTKAIRELTAKAATIKLT